MVKTIPLFIGAATLTLAIIVLYNVVQSDHHIINFFQFNRTNNEPSSISLHKPAKTPAQEIHLEKLQPDSPAREMFEKELSRISYNLKSGQIADSGPQSSVVYADGDAEKSVQQPKSMLSEAVIVPVQEETALNLNQLANENAELPNVPSQLNSETQEGTLNVPVNSNNQNVVQKTQLLNVLANQNSQNGQLQNVPVLQNDQNAQMPSVHNPQDWKIIHQSAQLSANHIEPHENQLINQPVQQHQQHPMANINYNSGGVWQPVEQNQLVQKKDIKAEASY